MRPLMRSWRSPPWSAHVNDLERPPYRIDYVWSRVAAASGRSLVPLSAQAVPDRSEASDHVPVVVDLEAIAFDAGE